MPTPDEPWGIGLRRGYELASSFSAGINVRDLERYFYAPKTIKKERRMSQTEELKKQGIQRFHLYKGEVILDFKQDSPRYRYVVTDGSVGKKQDSVRGVTTVLRDVLDKPGLRTWPMNMSHQFLFGSTWVDLGTEDGAGEWRYNPKTAALKPEVPYTEGELQSLMVEGTKQWTKRSDRGKDIGTLVHKACEMHVKGAKNVLQTVIEQNPDIPKDQKKALETAFKTFVAWWKSLPGVKVLDVECPVYSRRLDYAGTFDLAVIIGGKKYLLDLKTTNRGKEAPLGIYPEMFVQLGAYSYAYKEETGVNFDDVGIVNVGKDGRLSLATAADLNLTVDECERAFAFAIRLHDWVEKIAPLTKEQGFKSCLYYGSKDKVEVGTELIKERKR
jgi:hypothetical protein